MKKMIKVLLSIIAVFSYSSTIYSQIQANLALNGSDVICSSVSSIPSSTYSMSPLSASDYPADFSDFVGEEFAWDFTGGSSLTSTNTFISNNYAIPIEWDDDECSIGTVTAKYKLIYIDTDTVQQEQIYEETMNVNIVVPPTTIEITGPDLIECNDVTIHTYTVPEICNADYYWTVSSDWTINFGTYGNLLEVRPDSLSPGTITIQVACKDGCYNIRESKTVTRECPDNVTYSTATSTLGEHTATNDYIVAQPTTGSIEVLNGQTVRFRAGNYIQLLPNFKAHNGAYFKAKIGPCNDCTAKRINDDNNLAKTKTADESLIAYPNPTTGVLSLQIQGTNKFDPEDQVILEIYTLNGTLVQREFFNGQDSYQLDIKELPSSLYLINLLDASGKKYSTKIIKQ